MSSRGNFYLTWTPGQTYWLPHNRPSQRRLQNMGFTPGGEIWITTRGGDVLLSESSALDTDRFGEVDINSRGFGILDVRCASAAGRGEAGGLAGACAAGGAAWRTTA